VTSSLPVALVTGASSGVGRATAAALAARGYRVFGTSRNPSGDAAPGVAMLSLDVRDDTSVAACVAAVTARAGRIDLLVNNAGFEQAGALEELSLEEARAQFETNFFGVVRMVKELSQDLHDTEPKGRRADDRGLRPLAAAGVRRDPWV
jgi:NAD(P)-dependent dehydrogenase (short-subunit alcohol dehydrogenase family)